MELGDRSPKSGFSGGKPEFRQSLSPPASGWKEKDRGSVRCPGRSNRHTARESLIRLGGQFSGLGADTLNIPILEISRR